VWRVVTLVNTALDLTVASDKERHFNPENPSTSDDKSAGV
jgi:hypothetical protein